MSALRNRVQLIGFLGSDPEIRTIESGKKLVRIRVATNESYKNAKGEPVKDTQWHNVVAWEKTAELVTEKLRKGSEVMIEGRLSYNEYTDKEGVKRYSTDVVMVEFLPVSWK